MDVKSDIHIYNVYQACTHSCVATRDEGIQWFKDVCKCMHMPLPTLEIEPEFTLKRREWGPSFWMIIHAICLIYDQTMSTCHNSDQLFRSVILRIWKMLPCKTCSDSCDGLKAYERIRDDASWKGIDSLYAWSVDYHNQVNHHIDPTTITYTPSDVKSLHQAYISTWKLGTRNSMQYST